MAEPGSVRDEIVRRVRLPADRRTPSAARAVVRSVLEQADLPELLDAALLLTTELSTNAVVHAGTDLDLEVIADPDGLTVTVLDDARGVITLDDEPGRDRTPGAAPARPRRAPTPGAGGPVREPAGPVDRPARPELPAPRAEQPVEVPRQVLPVVGADPGPPDGAPVRTEEREPGGAPPPARPRGPAADDGPGTAPDPAGQPAARPELAERGRGLLLVDHFASRWGTTHYETGKGVWFRLNRPGRREPADAVTGLTRLAANRPVGAVADPTGIAALLEITVDPYAEDPIADFGALLLAKLAELVGAGGAVVRCDLGEGAGDTVLARYGRTPRGEERTVRVPLALGGSATGELELDAPLTDHVVPLAELVAERLSLALENDRLRRADRRRQTWLTFLAEASELLAQSLDVELTLALIPQLVVPRLGQWSAVHTTGDEGRLTLETAAHADEESLPALHATLEQTGPDSVLARLPGALRAGGQVPLPPPAEGFAIPLIARGQLLGTLSVGRHANRRHEPDELAVLQDVARRAALAVDNARIHAERRNVARTLQRSLLPPALPAVPGIGFGAAYVPTGDAGEVGGDFYDVVPLGERQWLVVVGDVSGKGVQAATVTGLVREVIRALVLTGRPLPEILERINETLVERGRGRYCTLALASVRAVGAEPDGAGGDERSGWRAAADPADGAAPARTPPRLEVSLHLAGHDAPVLVRSNGRTFSAGSGGTALGLLDTIRCPEETIHLAPNDSLVFFTDGVTERRRGRELFGRQRLHEAAAPLAHYSADMIAARLRATTLGFSPEPPRDDIALLVLRNELAAPAGRGRRGGTALSSKERAV